MDDTEGTTMMKCDYSDATSDSSNEDCVDRKSKPFENEFIRKSKRNAAHFASPIIPLETPNISYRSSGHLKGSSAMHHREYTQSFSPNSLQNENDNLEVEKHPNRVHNRDMSSSELNHNVASHVNDFSNSHMTNRLVSTIENICKVRSI